MIEWNKYPETFPKKGGKLLVIINGEMVIAEAILAPMTAWLSLGKNKIYFLINIEYEQVDQSDGILRAAKEVYADGGWIKPKLYAEITHWIEIPEPV